MFSHRGGYFINRYVYSTNFFTNIINRHFLTVWRSLNCHRQLFQNFSSTFSKLLFQTFMFRLNHNYCFLSMKVILYKDIYTVRTQFWIFPFTLQFNSFRYKIYRIFYSQNIRWLWLLIDCPQAASKNTKLCLLNKGGRYIRVIMFIIVLMQALIWRLDKKINMKAPLVSLKCLYFICKERTGSSEILKQLLYGH